MKRICIIFLGLFIPILGQSQILTFDFNGLTGNEATAVSNFNNANLGTSTISRGVGLTASANGDRYNATSWALTSIANAVSGNNYMEFTLTPNVGYQFDVSSIVISLQRSATGPSALAIRSSIDGYSTNLDAIKPIVDNTSTQTFTFTFTQANSLAPVTYRIYMYAEAASGSGGPGDFGGNDIVVNGSVSLPSLNSISTGLVSAPPFNVTCLASAPGTIDFTSTGTFTGNTYTAQLSNSSGSFVTPINVGTLISNANTGTINISIPPTVPTGSGYQLRVIASSPVTVGTASSSFTINLSGGPCSAFEIQSILVDACGIPEGGNEMTRFKVGALPLNTADLSVVWPNNSWLGLCQNATTASTVAAINATITGGGSLIEPVGGVLPANTEVMLFTSTDFTYSSFDFSTLNYTIYAIFQCPGNTAGHFVNYNATPGTYRTLTMTFSGFGSDAVTYDAHLVFNGDGAAVDFDPPGNPSYGTTGGCYPPLMPLPIELLSFNAKQIKTYVELNWITSSETNNDYFTIERSSNTELFEPILIVDGAGNSNSITEYSTIDKSPINGLSYYRLKQTDFDGKYTLSNVVPVVFAQSGTLEIISTYNDNSAIYIQILSENSSKIKIEVLNIIGQTISSLDTESEEGIKSFIINKEQITKGLYFIRVTNDSYSVCRKVSL